MDEKKTRKKTKKNGKRKKTENEKRREEDEESERASVRGVRKGEVGVREGKTKVREPGGGRRVGKGAREGGGDWVEGREVEKKKSFARAVLLFCGKTSFVGTHILRSLLHENRPRVRRQHNKQRTITAISLCQSADMPRASFPLKAGWRTKPSTTHVWGALRQGPRRKQPRTVDYVRLSSTIDPKHNK